MSELPEAGGAPLRDQGDAPATPRAAATVILLRRGGKHAERGLEVLLVQRNPEARFMPGVWVFPGGAVDADDGEGEEAHRAAAVRELTEEAGIEVPAEELVAYSRWITPKVVPIRFDTRFYLALAPAHSPPRPDGSETVDAGWFEPESALHSHHAGELPLVFPTIKHLESLVGYANAAEALEAARRREVKPVEPEVVGDGDERRIVLPDELP
ncbi:MAG TPA: NUDIX hydrolase [Solirubrobacterales bacterium]|nr:NUDIX hydrolase [Solirubrobacterales bacterium]